MRRVDLELGEERVHPEGARFVRHDRDDAGPEALVLEHAAQHPREGHRRRGLDLVARPLHEVAEHLRLGQVDLDRDALALGHDATELLAALEHVLHLRAVRAGVIERRLLELLVGDRELEPVAEGPQLLRLELLDLMGDVAALGDVSEGPTLDGLDEDRGRAPLRLGRHLVGRVELAVVVPAAAETHELLVAEVGDQLAELGIRAEEVFADVGARLDGVALPVAVERLLHLADQKPADVLGEQLVPLAAPEHLDDVPTGTAEARLELLHDLAVAAHRPIESLQIAVDDEDQVVEAFAAREREGAKRLRFVGLAVAEERPDPLFARVGEAAGCEVAQEARLVQRVQRPESHRDRRVLPELGHQARMGVAREATATNFAPESLEVGVVQPALEEGAGVHAGRGVALEVDQVAAAAVVLPAEEVVEANLIEAGGGGVTGQVAAETREVLVRAGDHRGRVPADQTPDAALHTLVAREGGLLLRTDRVDVARLGRRREPDVPKPCPLEDLVEQVLGAQVPGAFDHLVEGVEPFLGFL